MSITQNADAPHSSRPLADPEVTRCTLLPPSAQSPLAARQFTRETLEQWQVPPQQEVALILVVNELVTNAVVHTDGTVLLTLVLRDDAVRVVVGDDSAALPRERERDLEATAGRGLALVAAMSRRWGVHEEEGGKTVWAEVAVPHSDRAPG
jgi:two-component sensor histidine kinase